MYCRCPFFLYCTQITAQGIYCAACGPPRCKRHPAGAFDYSSYRAQCLSLKNKKPTPRAGLCLYARQGSPYGAFKEGRTYRPALLRMLHAFAFSYRKASSPLCLLLKNKKPTPRAGLCLYARQGSPYGAFKEGRTYRPALLRMLHAFAFSYRKASSPLCLLLKNKKPTPRAGLCLYARQGSPYGAFKEGRTYRPALLRMLHAFAFSYRKASSPLCLLLKNKKPTPRAGLCLYARQGSNL